MFLGAQDLKFYFPLIEQWTQVKNIHILLIFMKIYKPRERFLD